MVAASRPVGIMGTRAHPSTNVQRTQWTQGRQGASRRSPRRDARGYQGALARPRKTTRASCSSGCRSAAAASTPRCKTSLSTPTTATSSQRIFTSGTTSSSTSTPWSLPLRTNPSTTWAAIPRWVGGARPHRDRRCCEDLDTDRLYVLRAIAAKLNPDETIAMICKMNKCWGFRRIGIESNGFQEVMTGLLKKRLREGPRRTKLIPIISARTRMSESTAFRRL
jgi:hypothetical protein